MRDLPDLEPFSTAADKRIPVMVLHVEHVSHLEQGKRSGDMRGNGVVTYGGNQHDTSGALSLLPASEMWSTRECPPRSSGFCP